MKVSIIPDRTIGKAWGQEIRWETSKKMSSIGEVMDIREVNTSTNLTKGNKMLMLNEESN